MIELPQQLSERDVPPFRPSLAQKIGVCALTPFALGSQVLVGSLPVTAAVAFDALVTDSLEPSVAPDTKLISSPETCEKSSFVDITVSSMGLPVAQYMAANTREQVEAHGGCVVATSYGTAYTLDTSRELTKKTLQTIETVSRPGETKGVVFHAASFGVYPTVEMISSDAYKKAVTDGKIKTTGLILESTPSDSDSVKDPTAKALIELSKRSSFRIGKGVLGLINTFSTLEGGHDLTSVNTWDDIATNTSTTSTRLTVNQLRRIGEGIPPLVTSNDQIPALKDVPVYYIGSNDDAVVQNSLARQEFAEKTGTDVIYLKTSTLPGSFNHAGSWLVTEYDRAGYREAIQTALDDIAPPAPPAKSFPKKPI